MTIHAYQEMYAYRAQSALGDAFDYAINVLKMQPNDFITLFLVSSISKSMEVGEPKYVTGKSGIEILVDVIYETTGKEFEIEAEDRFFRTREYWIGWAVAYYQWYSNRSYSEIFEAVSFEELQNMYYTLHEADITKFVEIMDSLLKEYFHETNLKRRRVRCKLSQSKLAELSGVSLRSIQMYEQRNKDINKASADKLYRMAKILNCKMEDLIEK